MNNLTEQTVDRKKFLHYTAAVGAGLGLVYLAACKKKAADEAMETAPSAPASACGDVSTLSPEDKTLRENMVKSLQYTEKSTMADKHCSNCQFFQTGSPCGTCTLIKGPISSEGYCSSWSAKVG